MEPIDISSTDSESSDWDLEKYKALNDSPVRDSATSVQNSRVLPSTFASSSGTSNAGHHGSSQRALPLNRNAPINGHLSHFNHDLDLDDQLQIISSSSNNFGSSNNSKRMLPSSFQPSSSSSRPVKDVGSTRIRETYGNPYAAHTWQNHSKAHVEDTFSRASNDMLKDNNHGIRILPPSMKPHIPPPSYGGPSDIYRPAGVVDEQAVVDERHIYQVALQDLNQPLAEATLPEGLLSVSLLRHQKIALAWMVQKEQSSVACAGGILADDQGLGKTISTIALILKQKSSSKPKLDDSHNSKAEALNLDDDDGKATIVDDDKDEVKLITQASSSTQKLSNRKPAAGSLVVCPASVLRQWARELDDKVSVEAKLDVLIYHGGNRTKDPAELASYDVVLTTYAIVAKEVPSKVLDELDEDDLKNGDSYGLSSEFASKKRKMGISGKKKKGKKGIDGSVIDCSGTLAKVNWFRVILDEAQTIKNSRTQVAKSCCGLRAKKRWCLSGTPIQNSIDELFSYFRFLKCDPYANYKSFCSQIKIPISRNSMHGYKKLQAVLKAIMLRRTKGTLIDGKPIINLPPKTINLTMVDFSTEERAFYLKLEAESRSRFKAYAAAGTVSQNYANILLMLLRLRQACDHPLLVKGFSSESVSRVSTRMAKNLPKEMRANLLNLLETLNICCLCSDPPEDAVVTLCEHVFCYQCVSEYLTGDDNTCPSPKCKSPIGPDAVFNKATLRNSLSDDNSSSSSRIDEKSIVLQQDYSSAKIKAVIEIIRSNCRSKSVNSEAPIYSGKASCSSGVEGPIKAIVFSQWTRMLDLVEMSLNQYCFEYRRLDGSMSLASRDRAVKEFNTDPEVIVMLMSLKAGNLGLNMVAASHVILLDLWWNPTTEDQAIDRAHRIGQTRPVTVSRLTIKDTVEDRILALQEEKRKMVASAFGEDQSGTSAARLTAEDLRYLFMGGH